MAPVKVPKPSTQAKRSTRSAVTKQPKSTKACAKRANASAKPAKAIPDVTRLVGALRSHLVVNEDTQWGGWITWIESQLKAKARLTKDNAKLEDRARQDAAEYDQLLQEIVGMYRKAQAKAVEEEEVKERLQEEIDTLEVDTEEKAAEEEQEKERLQEEINTLEADSEEKAQEENKARKHLWEKIDRLQGVIADLRLENDNLINQTREQNYGNAPLQNQTNRLQASLGMLKARLLVDIEHWLNC